MQCRVAGFRLRLNLISIFRFDFVQQILKDAQDELKEGIHAQVVRCDEIYVQEKGSLYQVAIENFELCQ